MCKKGKFTLLLFWFTEMEVNLSTLTYESGIQEYEDFPHTLDPVYILGVAYSAIHDRDELKDDVTSRIWITYRKGFPSIGGVGPSSDQGWGCMLRCGQMMLAQTLLLRHLGRGWRWKAGCRDDDYWRILTMFEEKKSAIYSIHQIASMGESEGKAIGQWFGPNTIAQVLKRISVYDSWSDLAIHIALDNVVIRDDIRNQCRKRSGSGSINKDDCQNTGTAVDTKDSSVSDGGRSLLPDGEEFSKFVNDAASDAKGQSRQENKEDRHMGWKPLLLIIPLRLGLTDINPIYFDALKKCLALHQSVGIIGGKPNHAHWFIGYMGQELIYLDPHTTQHTVNLKDLSNNDSSYHCLTPPSRMSFHKLDPSIALGFYCADEKDFEDLCDNFTIINDKCMFEVRNTAPQAWFSGETTTATTKMTNLSGRNRKAHSDLYDVLTDNSSIDDEEFEII